MPQPQLLGYPGGNASVPQASPGNQHRPLLALASQLIVKTSNNLVLNHEEVAQIPVLTPYAAFKNKACSRA